MKTTSRRIVSGENQEFTVLEWNEFLRAVHLLGEMIRESDFKPDYLVGVATGGLYPLAILAKKLGNKNVHAISVSSYDKNVKRKEMTIHEVPHADFADKNILIIDEIVETGDTLRTLIELFKKTHRPREVRTAAVAVNVTKTSYYPDFWKLSTETQWTVFPWEREEFPELFE